MEESVFRFWECGICGKREVGDSEDFFDHLFKCREQRNIEDEFNAFAEAVTWSE